MANPLCTVQRGMPRKERKENETKMRGLHELPYTEIVKSGTFGAESSWNEKDVYWLLL